MTRPDETYDEQQIRQAAERYTEHFPWAETDSIAAYLSLLHTNRVHAVAIDRYFASLGLPRPITGARFTVLRTLYFANGQRLAQNEISRELGVSRTNITNLIDGLEKDDLVSRAASPSDRRVNHVELTPAGCEMCEALVPAVTQFMTGVFRGFDEAELAQLIEYLARMRRDMGVHYIDREPAEGPAAP